MDDVRLGTALRMLRLRRGLRQIDVARRIGSSQQLVSKIERGDLPTVSLGAIREVAEALEATATLELRWRGAALDRLLGERHAGLVANVVALLGRLGWDVVAEVSYSEWGERGSIDVLAWDRTTRSLLVFEVKTELGSIEATLRKHDEKTRLAPRIARSRFG